MCWPCTQGPTAHVGQAHSRSALIRASSRCRSATSAASWSIRFDTASRREECAARTSPGAVVVNDPEGTPRYPPNASAKQHNQRVISSRPQPPSGLHIRARTSHGSLNQPRLARNHGLIVTMFTPLCRSHVKNRLVAEQARINLHPKISRVCRRKPEGNSKRLALPRRQCL